MVSSNDMLKGNRDTIGPYLATSVIKIFAPDQSEETIKNRLIKLALTLKRIVPIGLGKVRFLLRPSIPAATIDASPK